METKHKRYHIKVVVLRKKILGKIKEKNLKGIIDNIIHAKLLPSLKNSTYQKQQLPTILISHSETAGSNTCDIFKIPSQMMGF